MGDVQGFDTARRVVLLADGEFPYDTLVIAAGAQSSYFGHDEWEHIAPGLKSIEDAIEIRRKVLTAFEAAERSQSEHFCIYSMSVCRITPSQTGCICAHETVVQQTDTGNYTRNHSGITSICAKTHTALYSVSCTRVPV
jgi:hypothetical protein